jgi:hypothetical protein
LAQRRFSDLPKVVLTQPTEDHMTKLKLTATAILLALLAACEPTPQPIAEAHAQQPTASTVFYPEPAEGSGDGQAFEY